MHPIYRVLLAEYGALLTRTLLTLAELDDIARLKKLTQNLKDAMELESAKKNRSQVHDLEKDGMDVDEVGLADRTEGVCVCVFVCGCVFVCVCVRADEDGLGVEKEGVCVCVCVCVCMCDC